MMEYLASILKDVLIECSDDYVGLWVIVGRVRWLKIFSDDEVFLHTMTIVKDIIADRNVIVGQFRDSTFFEWIIPKDEIIRNIELEWKFLGRDPNLGEIAWFAGLWARQAHCAPN